MEVDHSLEDAAEAFGMSKSQKLLKFELPIAMPVIMSGIRSAAVMIIGTATLAALIGAGGLGTFILLGIDRNNVNLILIGAVSSAVLAVLFSTGIYFLEKSSTKKIGRVCLLLLILLGGSFAYQHKEAKKEQLTIAGKLGAEPSILIHMYKELIEDQTDIQVNLKENFGKTTFLYNALKSGEIDIYPEFSGTILETFIKGESPESHDPSVVYETARDKIKEQDQLAYLKPMKYQNTYAIAVKRKFSGENNLKTIEDLKQVSNQLKAGFTLEFADREDGNVGLEKVYDLHMPVQTMEPSLRYPAIENGDINVVDAYSTDSELKQYDLVILEDNKQLFPPYQGAPLMKESTLTKYPELKNCLNQLADKISEEEMSAMNYAVNVDGKEPQEVAREYLVKHKLIKEK